MKRYIPLVYALLMVVLCNRSAAQTFNFPTSEASEIVSGDSLYARGFPATPDTLTIWCNEWDEIWDNPSSWGDTFKFKSMQAFVRFYVDEQFLQTKYQTPTGYTYRLTFRVLGYNELSDTSASSYEVDDADTLTISFNNYADNTPYQTINLKKYSGLYKMKLILTGLCTDSAGVIATASLADTARRNFFVEGRIITQRYDKRLYGTNAIISSFSALPTNGITNNYFKQTWNFASAPVSYEVEWTYVDDYKVSLPSGSHSAIPKTALTYDFTNNATRLWLSEGPGFMIPIIYPSGYFVYRVRAVRPDSVLFKYPIYGPWTIVPDQGGINGLDSNQCAHISNAYMGDSLNWQHTMSFAEGGKLKNVATFYDGLLKNRQSITKIDHGNTIVTNNIYDFEGRPSIKTLPAPVDSTGLIFRYQHNVDLNSVTGHPYKASDFDTGLAVCPDNNVISPLSNISLAGTYYSSTNPDSEAYTYSRFIPDADGYPLVQTIYEPGYADRVSKQGGAGPKLQIGDSNNIITNAYVSAMQKPINALFGPNIGWSSFYSMTVSQDPNQQLSMSLKDYHGKQMASSLIGAGNTINHALVSNSVPSAVFYKQDLLQPSPPAQEVDTVAGTRIADRDFFNQAAGVDSLQYILSYDPFFVCTGKYLCAKAYYNYYIIDKCGYLVFSQDSSLGTTGVLSSGSTLTYAGPMDSFFAQAEPYHLHKELAFHPSDIEAAVDTFFQQENCLRTQPSFIRESVENSVFPCTGNDNVDSTPCAKLKVEMMKQLFPGAVYGQYSTATGHVVGTGNSIFSLDCPSDTFHITRYADSLRLYCYDVNYWSWGWCYPAPTSFKYCAMMNTDDYGLGILRGGYADNFLYLPDTCSTVDTFTTYATILMEHHGYFNVDSIVLDYISTLSNFTGTYSLTTTTDSLRIENGAISPYGSIMADSTTPDSCCWVVYWNTITFPVKIKGDSLICDYTGTLPRGGTIHIKINFEATGGYSDSMHHHVPILSYDSVVSGYSAGTCDYAIGLKYRYQDTCTVPSLLDTITVNGVFYTGLRTMSADSFITIYNSAIVAGDYRIAEQLLPLHPQYCGLKHCYDDSFRTMVTAIPDWHVAQSLSLFELDDIIAHDPIVDSMTASGIFPSPEDTLRTFLGGAITLDTFLIMNAYCSCSDSIMFKNCFAEMFNYEITHRLLTNATVKDYYFRNIYSLYFSNRQRILDKLITRDGASCTHCADARMKSDPAATIYPPPLAWDDTVSTYDSAFADPGSTAWVYDMDSYSTDDLYDSTVILYHAMDSMLVRGQIDTIIAHLSNCISGNSTIATNIEDTLIAIYNSGAAEHGNFTQAHILYAINTSGASANDLCNPYILDCSQFGAPPPVAAHNCLPASYYTDIATVLNRPQVIYALKHLGSDSSWFNLSNDFEDKFVPVIGSTSVKAQSSYIPEQKLYCIKFYRASGTGGDTVRIYLHSLVCDSVFSDTACSGFSTSVACLNTSSLFISGQGLVNEYGFLATVTTTCGGSATTCAMTGWVDTVETMSYKSNALASCIPCTEMKALYDQFTDTMASYGVYGTDHPYYSVMLANFMNSNLMQSYASGDYETFIQSCALADSMKIPLYTGYSTFSFSSTANMNTFISALNSIDTLYSFNDSYRDSTNVGGSPVITVCVDLNPVPHYELWRYRDTLLHYAGTFDSSIVDSPLHYIKPAGLIGFMYVDPNLASPFSPADSNIIDTTTVKIRGPYSRALWTAGHFEIRHYYEFIDAGGTPPYEISQDVYSLSAYLYNKSIPGTVFTPCYQSTIDADYFKPEKQAYLKYTYHLQSLPPYEVIDSVQTQFLTSRIGSYSGYLANYSQPTLADFTNLYLFDAGMNNRFYDTLKKIFTLANNGTSGFIFPVRNDTVTFNSAPRKVTVYKCGDGTYWYRYFTTGDTLYNAYVSFPEYIPASLRHFYKEVSVIPNPGDSLNRSFTLMLVKGGTTDTIYVKGRASFTIGKSKELDNVLLGQSSGRLIAPSDTFYNCERQVLNSAIDEGIANYNEYLRHFRDSITSSFRSYLANTVNEKLNLGYLNQEFNYTLYNYDRAGNLTFTVPPAGVSLISSSLLDSVDGTRIRNNAVLCPPVNYTKKNVYYYNTNNQVTKQETTDGGLTRFFYDVAGRLIFSQNAKQALNGYYTYNIYDKQNRIVETGEALMGCPYFAPYYPGGGFGILPDCYYGYTVSGSFLVSPDPYFIQNMDKESADSLVFYIRSNTRRDIVRTVYDTAAVNLGGLTGHDAQQNLRKRVAAVITYDSLHVWDTASYPQHAYATHYSYDVDGNVKTLVQDFPELYDAKQQYKRIDYDYDLISGKVNMLSYNRGWPDQFYQRYFYDGANRIMEVQTSKDGWIWQKDAAYRYYEHGPLARVELGELHVQGIDYAYTIQGWLKAVNSDTLNADMDMGNDALFGSVNQVTSKDAVAYTIDYFNSDYKPITSNDVQHVTPVSLSLYNGNISRQTVAMDTFQKLNKQYMYDQLNRIHSATYASVDPVYHTLTGLADFHSNYSYDADGNLKTLVRYGNNTGAGAQLMDSLTYLYSAVIPNNQLTNIIEDAPDAHDNDIKYFAGPSTPGRYRHDAIGNTIGDLVAGQDTIDWNLYNKVVRTVNNFDTTYMTFSYDGAGNRVKKSHVKPTYSAGPIPLVAMNQENDYYVRDAQGNILAVYHENAYYDIPGAMSLSLAEGNFSLAEHDIYGSSRVGVKNYYKGQIGMDRGYAVETSDTLQLLKHLPWYSLEYQDAIKEDSTNLYGNTFTDMCYAQQTIGQKQYELTDHLGDVLATVSDKRAADSITGAHVTGQIDTISSWKPVVASATDYYPFGMQMPGRYTNDTATHCFDITQTKLVPWFYAQYFQADSFYFPITPYSASLASTVAGDLDLRISNSSSSYVTMDIDSLVSGYTQTISLVEVSATFTFDAIVSSGGSVVGSVVMNSPGTYNISFTPTTGTATITFKTHTTSGTPTVKHLILSGIYLPRSDSSVLENVVVTICNGDKYQYGFNGQMKVNEIAGAGNHNTALFWEYDTRTGRRWNLDPKPQISVSDYAAFYNNPIRNTDVYGDQATGFDARYNAMQRMLAEGKISRQQYEKFISDNGVAGAIGGAALLTVFTGGRAYPLLLRTAAWISVPTNQQILVSVGGLTASLLDPDPGSNIDYPGGLDDLARGAKLLFRNSKGVERFAFNVTKLDYFFGRVTSGNKHNIERSAQNLKDLASLGIKEDKAGLEKLSQVFDQGLNSPIVKEATNEFGTNVVHRVEIEGKGAIDVNYFYKGGDKSKTPEVTTIIPKVYKK